LANIYKAAIYIPTYHGNPLFNTTHCMMRKPKIFPKLGQVVQNPRMTVSLSGEKTEWMTGRRLGHTKAVKKPFNAIKMHRTTKAGVCVI
jgi:hypothetical protein